MNDIEHEWVENYKEFEAVLRCTNVLKPWDRNEALRAFQTFGWEDATLPGNDVEFKHMENAAIVRHDGDLIAIVYLSDKPLEALADLFLVLHGLGWKTAEVYHPAESISPLLTDIGKAIPASMDFDIRAARTVRAVSAFAEGETLVSRGTAMFNNALAATNADEIINQEMASMGSSIYAPLSPPIKAVNSLAAFTLDDEPETEPPFELPEVPPSEGVQVRQDVTTHVSPGDVSYVDEINVENDALNAEVLVDSSDLHTSLFVENEHLRELLAEANDRIELINNAQHQQLETVVAQNTGVEMSLKNQVRVGSSMFLFDVETGQKLSEQAVLQIADENAVSEILNINLGAIGGSLRWDLVSELRSEFPWIAHSIARRMGFTPGTAILVASILNELQKATLGAGLRDVLNICMSSGYDAKARVSAFLDQATTVSLKMLFSRLNTEDLTASLNEIVERLGPLWLSADGSSVLDVRPAGEAHQPGDFITFNLRDVFLSPKAKLYVISVDPLDSEFVYWMAELLRSLASDYTSTRHYKYEERVPEEPEEPEEFEPDPADELDSKGEAEVAEKQKLLVELANSIGPMLAKLRAMGMEI